MQNCLKSYLAALNLPKIMINALLQHIRTINPLSDEDAELIRNAFESKSFQKGSVLETEGIRTKNLYFVVSGFVRSFYYTNGEEVCTHIRTANNLITAFSGFINGTVSESNIQCISACNILVISRQKYEHLQGVCKAWQSFCRAVYEREITYNNRRTRELLSQTAEARYLKLLQEQPSICSDVPVRYIATYLGIKPESLSRIRRKIVS